MSTADDTPGLDLRQIQGNILRSYGGTYRHVRHLVLSVVDPARARAALASMARADGSTPPVTCADVDPSESGLETCLNVGITYAGLQALGLPKTSLTTFPREFRLGMVARAAELGDVGPSAPKHWIPGLADDTRVHLLVTIHAKSAEALRPVSDRVLDAEGCRAFAPVTAEPLDGAFLPDGTVHFGYRDGIAGPRFEGIHDLEPDPDPHPDRQRLVPIGVILLGHRVPSLGMTWRVPQPDMLGVNGTFGAFRVLRQDVAAFEKFLGIAAAAAKCTADEVAAKMCGRWRNGVPLVMAETQTEADELAASVPPDDFKAFVRKLDAFNYRRDDPDGARCPIGSHIRRSNPRDSHIVQRGTNAHRLVVRRGMPYGPPYNADDPSDNDTPRGLLGSFLCASIPVQFEVLQRDWINTGLQDPRITGTNDPLVGDNDGRNSEFRWTTSDNRQIVTRRLPSFAFTQGGAYHFMPSIPGLRWIGAAGWK